MNGDEKVFQRYMEFAGLSKYSRRYKKRIRKLIEENDIIQDIKFFYGSNETYFFNKDESFRAEIEYDGNKDLRMKFKARRNYSKTVGFDNYMVLYPKHIRKGKSIFEVNDLFLDSHTYILDIINKQNEKIISNIPIKISDLGKKKIPQKAIFVEEKNENSHFPNGDFLLVNSNDNNIKNSGNCVIVKRTLLWELNKARLFRNGDFEKIVSGDDIWCLVDEIK